MSWNRNNENNNEAEGLMTAVKQQIKKWPVSHQRQRVKWFPPRTCLIGMVRGAQGGSVLPPAIVRKAC